MIAAELFSRVEDYLDRRITLREVEAWLVPRLPILLASPDSPAARLASAVELMLAEVHEGIRGDRGARRLLARYRSREHIIWAPYGGESGSETETAAAATFAEPALQPFVMPRRQSPFASNAVLVESV